MSRQKDLFTRQTPMDLVRARRDTREKRLGPMLDSMRPEDLLNLCRYLFPQWPHAFGKRFNLQAVREDTVTRRLLLYALEESPSTEAA